MQCQPRAVQLGKRTASASFICFTSLTPSHCVPSEQIESSSANAQHTRVTCLPSQSVRSSDAKRAFSHGITIRQLWALLFKHGLSSLLEIVSVAALNIGCLWDSLWSLQYLQKSRHALFKSTRIRTLASPPDSPKTARPTKNKMDSAAAICSVPRLLLCIQSINRLTVMAKPSNSARVARATQLQHIPHGLARFHVPTKALRNKRF